MCTFGTRSFIRFRQRRNVDFPQPDERGDRSGVLVEYDATQKIFTSPAEQRTEDYVTGRFG